MMQFARRSRWFLPLTVLLTVVAVQLAMRADGSERQDRMSATTQMEEPDYEELEEELERPLEELVEAHLSEPTTARSRKRLWRVNLRRKAVLVPLILVAVTATFVAAGFVAKRYQLVPGLFKKKLERDTGKETAGNVSAPPRVGATAEKPGPARPIVEQTAEEPDTSGKGLTTLLRLGRLLLPPAAALAIAAGAVSMALTQPGLIPAGTPSNTTSSP